MQQSENHRYFTKIYHLYYSKCVLFAQSYTHSRPQAQDIVAEAMMVLWDHMCAGEEVELPLPFLLSVIRNKIMQYFRRELFQSRLGDAIKSAHEAELEMRMSSLEECNPYELYYEDVRQILNRSLDEMSEQTRRIFRMSRFRRMTNREIAREMGISVKSVEYHITRALKKLRRDLGDYNMIFLYFSVAVPLAGNLPECVADCMRVGIGQSF